MGSEEREAAGAGGGRASLLYRLVWWPLFLVVTAATLAGPYSIPRDYAQWRPLSDFGLRWNAESNRLGQPIGDESRASGIEAGRTVLSVNGRRPGPGGSGQSAGALIAAAGGDTLVLVTGGPDGDVRTHRLRRGPHHLDQAYAGAPVGASTLRWIENSLEFLAGLLGLAAAFLLYRRHRRDRVAAILSLAFLLLSGEGNAADSTFNLLGATAVPFTVKTTGYAALFIGILLFPTGRFRPRWAIWLAPAVAAWATLAIAAKFGDLPLTEEQMNLVGGALALLSVALLAWRYRRLPPSIERQQVRWATFGFVVGAALFMVTTITEQAMARTGDPATYAWLRLLLAVVLPAAPLALAAGLLVSLLRFRLYDADAAISRSAGYAVLTLLLAGVFAATTNIIEWIVLTSYGQDAGALPGAIGAGLAVILITPLHDRIQGWAEQRFQKNLLQLRRDLPEAVGDLRETASLSELLDDVLARIEAGVHSVRSAVRVDGALAAARGEGGDYPVSVPLRAGEGSRESATLLVGPRPDGSPPGRDEREALREIAAPVARAIEVVRRREAREAALEERLAAMDRRIAALRVEDGETSR